MEKRVTRLVLFLFPQLLLAANLVPVSIMTFNIENGGTQVSFSKVVEAIKRSGADVVGLQEPWGNSTRLAKELGWKYCNPAQHIISRFPLYETSDSHNYYTLIEVDAGRFIAMSNVHLLNEAYGPDLLKAGKTAEQVEVSEKRIRVPTVLPFIKRLAHLAQKGMPVFLVGDFNSGSHLDWTQAAVGKLANHRLEVKWPVTQELQRFGFTDSYHQLHKDIVKSPGYTWPARRPVVKNSRDHFNPSSVDLPERIDFIFSGGPAAVHASKLIGELHNQWVDVAVVPWPSDHRALVSEFEVNPISLDKTKLIIRLKPKTLLAPQISVSKSSVKVGESFFIRWIKAPGNRFDYIRIARGDKSTSGTCVYTQATIKGVIRYQNSSDVSRLDCFGKQVKWPLSPGEYTINLMRDDSFTVLATTHLTVHR